MPDRGRLFYDSDGKLRQVDPDANISGAPAEADLEPVEFVAVTTDSLDYGGSGAPTDIIRYELLGVTSGFTSYTTTNTSYTSKARSHGVLNLSEFASGDMVAVANFRARLSIDDAAETVSAKAIVLDDDNGSTIDLAELTHTGDTDTVTVESGWIDLSTKATMVQDGLRQVRLSIKSSAGTATATVTEPVVLVGRQPP